MLCIPWINDVFTLDRATPEQMDALWAAGWRHFGSEFFRYSITVSETGTLDQIIPLRIRLSDFSLTKSQRRVWNRNEDVRWEIRPAGIDPEIERLFELHVKRFRTNVPESIQVFLGGDLSRGPCECLQFRAMIGDRLMAVSFLDLGAASVSSVYAVFDPEFSRRSPGILTMLKEIRWAAEHGMDFHLPGYGTRSPGAYEYKKQFRGLQGYDWISDAWLPWSAFAASTEANAVLDS